MVLYTKCSRCSTSGEIWQISPLFVMWSVAICRIKMEQTNVSEINIFFRRFIKNICFKLAENRQKTGSLSSFLNRVFFPGVSSSWLCL